MLEEIRLLRRRMPERRARDRLAPAVRWDQLHQEACCEPSAGEQVCGELAVLIRASWNVVALQDPNCGNPRDDRQSDQPVRGDLGCSVHGLPIPASRCVACPSFVP